MTEVGDTVRGSTYAEPTVGVAQAEPTPRSLNSRGANVFGLADQGLISATNFVTLLVLGRALTASAFGAFALAYTVLIFVNLLQSALVTQPHNVLGAAREGLMYRRFTVATIAAAVLFMLAVVVVLIPVNVVVIELRGATPLLVAMIPATVAWQLQELARRILYTEGRLGRGSRERLRGVRRPSCRGCAPLAPRTPQWGECSLRARRDVFRRRIARLRPDASQLGGLRLQR